jgi:MFS family permease
MILAAFQSFPGLVAFRFILGAFEASIAPTSVPPLLGDYDVLTSRMMILVSGWWTRREQPLRNNLWYSANGIALILGSLIAWGLGHISNGALYVYQYIFLGTPLLSLFPTQRPFLILSHVSQHHICFVYRGYR